MKNFVCTQNCHKNGKESHKNWCMKNFVCAVFKSLILIELFNLWFKILIAKIKNFA